MQQRGVALVRTNEGRAVDEIGKSIITPSLARRLFAQGRACARDSLMRSGRFGATAGTAVFRSIWEENRGAVAAVERLVEAGDLLG